MKIAESFRILLRNEGEYVKSFYKDVYSQTGPVDCILYWIRIFQVISKEIQYTCALRGY